MRDCEAAARHIRGVEKSKYIVSRKFIGTYHPSGHRQRPRDAIIRSKPGGSKKPPRSFISVKIKTKLLLYLKYKRIERRKTATPHDYHQKGRKPRTARVCAPCLSIFRRAREEMWTVSPVSGTASSTAGPPRPLPPPAPPNCPSNAFRSMVGEVRETFGGRHVSCSLPFNGSGLVTLVSCTYLLLHGTDSKSLGFSSWKLPADREKYVIISTDSAVPTGRTKRANNCERAHAVRI